MAALPVAPVAPLAPVPAIRAEASRYSHMKAERLADAMGSVQRTPLTQENGITFLGEPLEPSVTWLPPGFFDRVQPRDATLADAARDEHTLKDGTVLKL